MKGNRIKKNNKNNLYKKYSFILIVSLAFFVTFILIYNAQKKDRKISVTETANTDYKVYLKDNKFYKEEYIDANKQYVDSLIKNIKSNYNYKLNSNNVTDFNYTYKIDALLDVYDNGTKKSLYTHTENLLEENSFTSNNGQISINEEIDIDYQHFNNIANRFMETYSLSNTNGSKLKINLIVKPEFMEETVITLSIPLTKNTFDIETSNQLASKHGKISFENKDNKTIEVISILGILSSICVFIFFTYKLIVLILDGRTDEEKYKSSVKKILASYGGYINKTDDFQFNLNEYEIIRVNTFVDLLKIKEDLSRPILMIENKERTSVAFAITDNSNFIYMFALNMYQKKLAEKNEQRDINVKAGVD